MAKEVYVERGRNMKTVDSMGKLGSVELGAPGFAKDGAFIKNDLTKASFDVTVDVGPSSASQRQATVQTLTGMLAVTQDPQTRQVLEAMALLNMEGDGITETREYFRKQLVQMGVLEPTKEEAEAMSQEKEPSAQDQALLAMAQESLAKAEKIRADIIEVMSKVDLNKAKTAETYSDVDRTNFMAVQQMLEKMKQEQLQVQQMQQMQMQRMQQMQQQPGMAPAQIPNAR